MSHFERILDLILIFRSDHYFKFDWPRILLLTTNDRSMVLEPMELRIFMIKSTYHSAILSVKLTYQIILFHWRSQTNKLWNENQNHRLYFIETSKNFTSILENWKCQNQNCAKWKEQWINNQLNHKLRR